MFEIVRKVAEGDKFNSRVWSESETPGYVCPGSLRPWRGRI